MGLIAVPNVSEGRDRRLIATLVDAIARGGSRIVDTHTDEVHNRTVFTMSGEPAGLVASLTALACASRSIDLGRHSGVHPWLGVLDVCPIVPHGSPMPSAVETANLVGQRISDRCGLPVYLYGKAARREETREVPHLRAGGLRALIERSRTDLPPDLGPARIDPRVGVVCVGAREPLVAFNIWLEAPVDTARAIARKVRSKGDGPPGVRALGLKMDERTSQISMNLVEPEITGIDVVFPLVKELTEKVGATVIATEIVGVPPERFMPDPKKEAARLLKRPGRSLESALAG